MEKNFDQKELDSFLNSLSIAKDEESIESYIYIKNRLDSIVFTVPFTVYGKGTRFLRSRAHKKNEDFFETVDQLSYRQDIQNIKSFGRANEPGQSIFYCSNNGAISFAESSLIVRDDDEKDFEYITSGIWVLTEDIFVVNLLTNENIKGQNSEFDKLTESFENMINSQNDENAFVVRSLLRFFSKEFSTSIKENSNHYKLTSAFANYVFSLDKADGILYPSTKYTKEGFNFALRTDVVDEKMKFYGAQRIKMQRVGDKKYNEVEKFESEISVSDDNIIKWIR